MHTVAQFLLTPCQNADRQGRISGGKGSSEELVSERYAVQAIPTVETKGCVAN